MKKGERNFSWMNPKLEVRDTKKYGKGVFAKEDIKKNELLACFGGFIMKISEQDKMDQKIGDYSLQISEELVIGYKSLNEVKDDDTNYFNHNCSPNAGFNGQIFLVAMNKIKKDKEITFDYSMVLHKAKNTSYYEFECLCGSDNCRKIITENDWKIAGLQKKYNGYFQYYLQKIINNK